MRFCARFILLPMAALLIGAAPAQRIIPFPDVSGWSLVIPTNGPMKFRGFGPYGIARFNGRVTLKGSFTYGCDIECDGQIQTSDLVLVLQPDRETAALLPYVKDRGSDTAIYIRNGSRAARAVTTQQERDALRAGRVPYVQGRITMVVDDLEISGDCDSVFYSVRFVSVPKQQRLATAEPAATAGCG